MTDLYRLCGLVPDTFSPPQSFSGSVHLPKDICLIVVERITYYLCSWNSALTWVHDSGTLREYNIQTPLTIESKLQPWALCSGRPRKYDRQEIKSTTISLLCLMVSLSWANGFTVLSPSPPKVQNDADPMSAQIIPPPKPGQLRALHFACSLRRPPEPPVSNWAKEDAGEKQRAEDRHGRRRG